MMELRYRRPDGSFVATVNGFPYHVMADDPWFSAASAMAAQMGEALPFEPGPPPAVPVVPAYVRKLALVRALREVGLDGEPDNPVKAWPVVRAAIEAADDVTQEDWALAVEIPRDDPALAAIAAALDVEASVLDAVFIAAAQIGG